MMIWFIVMLVVFGVFKIIVFSFFNFVIEFIISKYEIYLKFEEENVIIIIYGNNVEGEQKLKIIYDFNEGLFLDCYYVLFYNEGIFLIIYVKCGKKDFIFYIYSYEEYVDVVK